MEHIGNRTKDTNELLSLVHTYDASISIAQEKVRVNRSNTSTSVRKRTVFLLLALVLASPLLFLALMLALYV